MSVKKAFKKMTDSVVDGLKKPIDDSRKLMNNFFQNLLLSALRELWSGLKDSIGKPIMTVINSIVTIFMVIKNWLMNIISKIVNIFNFLFYYVKCGIKLLTNFYKCIIFYILDVLKYTFIHLPIFIIMNMIGLKKEWNNVQEQLDKVIGWPNGIQNDCYRCTNKKGEKFELKKLFSIFEQKQKDSDSKFNFFFFMLVCGVAAAMMFTFWHVWLRKNI